jgi:Flp pilus assembly protein TadD
VPSFVDPFYSRAMRHLLLLSVAVLGSSCLPRSAIKQEAVEHNYACTLALDAGDCKAATAHCDHALEFNPDYPEAIVNKGLIAWKCEGDTKGAREFFIKALRLDNESAQAFNNLGVLEMEGKDYGSAEKRFLRALQVNPDYHEARFNLARTYQSMGKREDAEKHLRQLLATNPAIADAQSLLGILRLEAGDLDEALQRFDAAVLLVPNHPDYHYNRGVAYAKAGRLNEAKEEFGTCLSLKPDSVECRHNLDVLLKGE